MGKRQLGRFRPDACKLVIIADEVACRSSLKHDRPSVQSRIVPGTPSQTSLLRKAPKDRQISPLSSGNVPLAAADQAGKSAIDDRECP